MCASWCNHQVLFHKKGFISFAVFTFLCIFAVEKSNEAPDICFT